MFERFSNGSFCLGAILHLAKAKVERIGGEIANVPRTVLGFPTAISDFLADCTVPVRHIHSAIELESMKFCIEARGFELVIDDY